MQCPPKSLDDLRVVVDDEVRHHGNPVASQALLKVRDRFLIDARHQRLQAEPANVSRADPHARPHVEVVAPSEQLLEDLTGAGAERTIQPAENRVIHVEKDIHVCRNLIALETGYRGAQTLTGRPGFL